MPMHWLLAGHLQDSNAMLEAQLRLQVYAQAGINDHRLCCAAGPNLSGFFFRSFSPA